MLCMCCVHNKYITLIFILFVAQLSVRSGLYVFSIIRAPLRQHYPG